MLTVGPPPDVEPKRRNPWIWVSAVLAVVAAGLLIWGPNAKSDADKAYLSALGALFGGESAETVRKELEGITATCKDALADA